MKLVVKAPISYFTILKETHVSIRHTITLGLKKSDVSFFSIDRIYLI